jgi:two-component system phosphate regulon response regulator OmpR
MDELRHILVVDDDTRLRDLLRNYLSRNGFAVTSADDAGSARRQLESMEFDLIVLDVMMPGETGLELARSLRRERNDVPILMLTAMGEATDRIGGLEAGADEYLPKPFEPRELLLRIQTILRRASTSAPAPAPAPSRVRLGDHIFDRERAILQNEPDGEIVRLTTAEASLLSVLSEVPGEVLSRKDLTERCMIDGGDRAIDVQVTRLRRKIERDPRTPRYLQTVRGHGYVLRPD